MNETNSTSDREWNRDFDLYKLFIDQVKHEHTRWVDNFGVLTTWNAIVLAVSVTSIMGIFGYFGGDPDKPSYFIQSLRFSLIPLALSWIGVAMAFTTMFVIFRIHSSSQDWYCRLRFFEGKVWDSRTKLGERESKIVPPFRLRSSEPFVCRGVRVRHLYDAVSCSFIIIYNVIAWVLLSRSISLLGSAALTLSYSLGVYLLLIIWNNRILSPDDCADWDTDESHDPNWQKRRSRLHPPPPAADRVGSDLAGGPGPDRAGA